MNCIRNYFYLVLRNGNCTIYDISCTKSSLMSDNANLPFAHFQSRLATPTLVKTVAVASLKQTATLASAERTTQDAAVRRVRIRCSAASDYSLYECTNIICFSQLFDMKLLFFDGSCTTFIACVNVLTLFVLPNYLS